MSKHIGTYSSIHGPAGRLLQEWIEANITDLWTKVPERITDVGNTGSIYTGVIPGFDAANLFTNPVDKLLFFTPHVPNNNNPSIVLNGGDIFVLKNPLGANLTAGSLLPTETYILWRSGITYRVLASLSALGSLILGSGGGTDLYGATQAIAAPTLSVDFLAPLPTSASRLILSFDSVVLEDPSAELYIKPYINGVYDDVATDVYNTRPANRVGGWTAATNVGGPGFSVNHPAQDDYLFPCTISGEVIMDGPNADANWKNIWCRVSSVEGPNQLIRPRATSFGAPWTMDAGWTSVAGVARHNGAAGGLYFAIPDLVDSKFYRAIFDVPSVTVGTGGVTPALLTAGPDAIGTPVTAVGLKQTQILQAPVTALTGQLAFSAAATFQGDVDNVGLEGPEDSATAFDSPVASFAQVLIKRTGKLTGFGLTSAVPGVGFANIKSGNFHLRALA